MATTTAEYRNLINSKLPTNGNKQISASKLREALIAGANATDAVVGIAKQDIKIQGNWNANTNSPNLSALSLTDSDIGKGWLVSVAGTNSLTGSSYAWKKNDTAVWAASGWIVKEQSSDELTRINYNENQIDKTIEDTIGELKRYVSTPMSVVTRNASNVVIANPVTTVQSIDLNREIAITGYDDVIDSYQEMFNTLIDAVGYKTIEFKGKYISSKSANPYIGIGFEAAGESIGVMYRVDGRIGWLGTSTSSGGVQTVLVNDASRVLSPNDIVTITLTPSAVNVAVSVLRNGVEMASYTINKVVTGNILLSSRGSAIYTCNITTKKEGNTIDVKIETSNIDAKTYADNRIDPIIIASSNLMPQDFVDGSSYTNSTGSTYSSAGNKRTANLIPVLPNTTYTISGINTLFPGNEYNSNVAGPGSRVQVIAVALTAPSFYNKITFTTSPTTTHLGINVRGNSLTDTSSTSMLQLGSIENPVFESFGDAYLDGGKIRGEFAGYAKINDVGYSNMYLTFNATGYYNSITGSNTEQFIVYCKLGNQNSLTYAGFKVIHLVTPVNKQDIWKITGADLYTFNGSIMSSAVINLLNPSESEFVYQQLGKPDHTGGYHGDEVSTTASFFIDSVKLTDLTTPFALKPCKDFWYVQLSDLLETNNTEGVPIADTTQANHYKKTWFKGGGYKTINRLKWLIAGLNIQKAYTGIVTIAPAVSEKWQSESGIEITGTHLDSTGVHTVGETGSREICYYHTANKIGARVSSKIVKAVNGATDNTVAYDAGCFMDVWDNINYAKYYRILQSKTTSLNEIWEFECLVDFFKSV